MKLKKRIACLVLALVCMHPLFAQFSAEEHAQIDSLNRVVNHRSVHVITLTINYSGNKKILSLSHVLV